MKRFLRRFVWVFYAIILAACASPDSRIKKNPALFAGFPPDVQEQIRQGRITIGFKPEMVAMALGEPDRKYSRLTGQGALEVWSYTATKTTIDRQRVNADVRYRDASGRMRTQTDWIWVDVNHASEYDRIRVEFTRGVVSAVDILEQD